MSAELTPMEQELADRDAWNALTPTEQAAAIAEIEAMPCEMFHAEPFDFAFCERHDTTFALGDVCKYKKINDAKDQP